MKYIIKRCKEGNRSENGFIYPDKGYVEALDWKDTKECGNGLHGWTERFDSYFDNSLKGNFVILQVDEKDGYIELDDKVKFKRGKVLLNTPDKDKAYKMIRKYCPNIILHWDNQISDKNEEIQTAGSGSVQTAESYSTQTTGSYSTQTAENYSTQTAGSYSTQTAGNGSTQTAGSGSTQTTGSYSTQTAGNGSTQKTGSGSTQKAGSYSTQTAEIGSAQTAGDGSTQTAGNYSTQKAGSCSTQKAGSYSFINHYTYNNSYNIVKPSKYSVVSSINIIKDIARSFVSKRDDITYVINDECKIDKKYTITDENIKRLTPYEIFVFGSNENGNHIAGTAKLALERFGAKNGVGEGLKGQSYAFPTLNKEMKQRTLDELKESVEKLYKCASKNTDKIFLLTKVGCGIAGYDEDIIKELFKDAPANIIKPWKY
jgi:hypothetical protein